MAYFQEWNRQTFDDLKKRIDDKNSEGEALLSLFKKHRISLPGKARFDLGDNYLDIYLGPELVCCNMQEDSAAFEGWSLAIKRWMYSNPTFTINLQWMSPIEHSFEKKEGLRHYQRFLYRVIRFKEAFSWFRIGNESLDLLSKDSELLNIDGDKIITKDLTEGVFINAPIKKREGKKADRSPSKMKNEDELEKAFNFNPSGLMKAFNCKGEIQRQWPVGIFADHIETGRLILTGGKSMIDLVLVTTDNRVGIFELKKPRNISIGTLSELMFYCNIIRDVQLGLLGNKPDIAHPTSRDFSIRMYKAKSVTGFILANRIHPLLDEKVITILNDAFCPSNSTKSRRIKFGWICYPDNLFFAEKCILKLPESIDALRID